MANLYLFVSISCLTVAFVLFVSGVLRWMQRRVSTPKREGTAIGWLRRKKPGAAWVQLLERQQIQAGRSKEGTEKLLVAQFILALGGALVAWLLVGPWAMCIGILTAGLPLISLRDIVRRRHADIRRALPSALDLMGMSVESGLDFGMALARSVERLRPGPLRQELESTLRELRMGKTRAESLSGLRERVAIPEIAWFVSAVVQADKMGSPLGQILRSQTAQLQTARTQRAEALAAEAPVKLLLPLVVCIFPTVFLILLGPIVFAILHGMGGG